MKKILLILSLMTMLTQNVYADTKVSVMLAWFMNPNYGNFVIAQKKGFFKKRNLDVTLLEPTNPSDPPKFLAIKKVDYALSHQPSLQMEAVQDWKISRVATMVNAQLNSIVFLEKSGIKSVADLKGKVIGYSIPGFDDVLLKTILKKEGLSLSDVKLININWAIASSLLTGGVDAVIGAYRTFEKLEMESQGVRVGTLLLEENGIPIYDEIIMLAHNDNRHSKTTCDMIDALEESVHYIRNHPEETWDLFKSYKPDMLDNDLNYKSWTMMANRFSLSPSALDVGRYNKMKKYLEVSGLVEKEIPDIDTYAINPFVKGCN